MIDPTLAALLDGAHRDDRDSHALLVAADRAQECGLPTVEKILRLLAEADPGDRCATGSRKYGQPTEASDWDWVYRLHFRAMHECLRKYCDPSSSGQTVVAYDDAVPYRLSGSYRFGPLNLITVDTTPQMQVSKEGTFYLCAESGLHGPRSRERAIEVFQREAARRLKWNDARSE